MKTNSGNGVETINSKLGLLVCAPSRSLIGYFHREKECYKSSSETFWVSTSSKAKEPPPTLSPAMYGIAIIKKVRNNIMLLFSKYPQNSIEHGAPRMLAINVQPFSEL